MSFEIGDVAIAINCKVNHVGREVEILSPLELRKTTFDIKPLPHYKVRFDDGEVGYAEPSQLKKKYDGNSLSTWGECAWQPKELEILDV